MNRQAAAFCSATLMASSLLAADTRQDSDTFDAFIKRDQAAFEQFRTGKPASDRTTAAETPARDGSPERKRAETLYGEYCRLRGMLDDPDPAKGINTRIAALRAKLYPTNRPWVDCLSLWGDQEWKVDWPLLQDLEARAVTMRADLQKLETAWHDEGFASRFFLGLGDCYGRKTWYTYLDTADQSVFPSPIRSNQVDYVSFQMDYMWPTNTPPAATTAAPKPEEVVHDTPPPPVAPPPEIPEIDEEIREENIEVVKPWESMTPEERRRALMENRPEAWSGFCHDVFGTDTNGQALAKAVVACSNVTAEATNTALANLPPPAAVATGKAWDAMTPEQRHAALKANETLAWDGLRDALLSGDGKRLQQVLEALSPKPVITDVARAVAYWHGYQTAQMEAATSPGNSNIAVIAAAYVHPELMALVRQGYADMQAGKPPQYTLPGADAMQSLMPSK